MTFASPVVFWHTCPGVKCSLSSRLSFTPSGSGSLSFCHSKLIQFHLWLVLGCSLLSWTMMTLCAHCSPPSQKAPWPTWKCSCPFWSQGYRVGRKRRDAMRLQSSLRDTCPVLSALTFCWALFTWILQRPLFLQVFLEGGQYFNGEARVWSGWGAAQAWLSHSPGTWHLWEVREEHELCLWGDAAAKTLVAAKRGSCSVLAGDGRREPEWIRGMKWQNTAIEGLNRKAQVTAHFLKGVSGVAKKYKIGATALKHDMIFLSPSTGPSIKFSFVCCLLWMCLICKTKKPHHELEHILSPSPRHC